MASIRQRGDSYTITVSAKADVLGNRKRYYKTVKRDANMNDKKWEKELNYVVATFEKKILDEQYLDGGRMTLANFVNIWRQDYAQKHLAPKTLQRYDGLLTKIIAAMGHLQIGRITPNQIQKFYRNLEEPGIKICTSFYPTEYFLEYIRENDLKPKDLADLSGISIKTARDIILRKMKTNKAPQICENMKLKMKIHFRPCTTEGILSNQTILHHHRLLSSILEKAVKWQLIVENPAKRVEPPKVEERQMGYFREEDLVRLFQLLDGEHIKYRTWIYTAIFTGCRLGELGGLMWDDIDFTKETIRIHRALQSLPKAGTYIKETKNKSSHRIIAMPKVAMQVLGDYKSWQEGEKEARGDLWVETGMVFTKQNGELMYQHTPSQWFAKFRKKHSLPDVSFHGLRHTNATLLIAEGGDIRTIAERLGHARTSTTTDKYSHFLTRPDVVAANKLDTVYNRLTQKDDANEKCKL